MKNLVVFGGQQITIDCLKILKHTKKVSVIAVIGCEKPSDQMYGYPSIPHYCQKNNLLYFQPKKLDGDFLKLFTQWKPDLVFSLYYRNIFQKSFLSVPKMGYINIHPSLLPKYRGPVPSLWAMLNNEKVTGVTLHYINEGIDSGDIIGQSTYRIPVTTTGFELHKTLMNVGARLFQKYLPSILSGKNPRIKQDHSQATYYGAYMSNLRKIQWFASTEQILRQIRAFSKPYRGAVASIQKKEVVLWNAKRVNLSKRTLSGPGHVIRVVPHKFLVSTADGYIIVDSYDIPHVAKKSYTNYIAEGKKFDLL